MQVKLTASEGDRKGVLKASWLWLFTGQKAICADCPEYSELSMVTRATSFE